MRAFVLLFLLPGWSQAQPLAHTLLWRIEGAQGVSSYLYGTMHTRDERAFQFTDSVLPAMDRCSVVAGELDLAIGEQGVALLKRMWMPDGKVLADLYKKKDWRRVDEALVQKLGMAAPMLHRVKPLFVVAMLTESDMGGARTQVLDEYLQIRGRDMGKRIVGLETVDEQLEAMDALPLKEQAAVLLDHIDHGGYAEDLEAMTLAYAAQDLEGLMKASDRVAMPGVMEKALLTDRNARMVQRIDAYLEQGESVFFLIGAAHLPGPDGLIEGLLSEGYRVTPVLVEP